MSTTDCRTLHIYRVPVHQKRTLALENYASISPLRLPSPNRVKFASGRRHSTPQTSAKLNSIDFQPQSHITNKDSNLSSDAAKPPSRPVSLVKLRPSEERLTRLVTTPTSIHSFTDVILPIAKKNRNTFIETSNPIPSDTQFKRTKATSNDLETRTIVSSEDNATKSKSRRLNCNFCHWYCTCRFYSWILCFLFIITVVIGLRFCFKLISI